MISDHILGDGYSGGIISIKQNPQHGSQKKEGIQTQATPNNNCNRNQRAPNEQILTIN